MAKLLSALPVGSIVKDVNTKYKGKPIVWYLAALNHSGYPTNSATLFSKNVIAFKAFDAAEPNNEDTYRKAQGNDRYALSNIRQWLNSDTSSWYAMKHLKDAPPIAANLLSGENPYRDEPGFLTNFSNEMKNVLLTTSLITGKNTVVDGGSSETLNDKVFLLSNTEVGFANENIAEGRYLTAFFAALTIAAKKGYPTEQISTTPQNAVDWWLRTTKTDVVGYARTTNTQGTSGYQSPFNGSLGIRPALNVASNLLVSDTPDTDGAYTILFNNNPTVTITSPTANQTLYENSSLTMAGNTTDSDIDNVVTVKYQIDSGTVRNLHSAVSDGTTAINFSKALIYKDGILYDGATAITSGLAKDTPHTVSIWAEDDKGGKSSIITRTFFVVPNRPPSVTINTIAQQTDLINSNVINVSGIATDADSNDVTVTFSINGGEEQQVYQGPPASFTFNILLADLKVGANTVVVKATDTYNTSGTKTLTINKTHNAVPVNKAVARYQIQAPTGNAKSILLWITRTLGNLGITAEVSMTSGTEAENYIELEKTNSAVVNGLKEEEFAYQGTADKEKIILKITYDRTDATVIDTIKQISGVLF